MASPSTPVTQIAAETNPVLVPEGPVQANPAGFDAATLAALQLSASEVEAGLISLESDLAYVMEEAGVEMKWRGYIGSLGLTRLNAFAMQAPNEEKMSEVLKQEFGLDPKASIKARV